MEDIMEVSRGHRDVPEELIRTTFVDMDKDANGLVDFDEFMTFWRKNGLLKWSIQIRER